MISYIYIYTHTHIHIHTYIRWSRGLPRGLGLPEKGKRVRAEAVLVPPLLGNQTFPNIPF